jgi:hypothetical protein
MVGVEFVTRRIAPLQDHHREIWTHRAGTTSGFMSASSTPTLGRR